MFKSLIVLLILSGLSFAGETVGLRDNQMIVILKDNVLLHAFKMDEIQALSTTASGGHFVVLKNNDKLIIPIEDQRTFDYIANKLIQQK